MNTALGLLAVLLLTLATGYFVAQEFAFVAADRGVLREQADAGDAAAKRALEVTGRLSFMLSGAQLGITVTALLVGFISEPAIATVIRPWLESAGVPVAAVGGIAVALAVAVATVVQMVLGELAPKNLGIARPEPVAKFLAGSTLVYLRIAGPVIRLFDAAATGLLRRVGVEPVEEVEHGASPEELSRIISESATAGDLPRGCRSCWNVRWSSVTAPPRTSWCRAPAWCCSVPNAPYQTCSTSSASTVTPVTRCSARRTARTWSASPVCGSSSRPV